MTQLADKVEEAIQSTILDQLDDNVVRVSVAQETDFEGDPILSVFVILKDADRVDHKTVVGLARHLRNRLRLENEFRFPIVRIVSQQDADEGVVHGAG